MKENFLQVVESKRFLGREFLTWLIGRLEDEGGRIEIEGDLLDLALGDRVILDSGGDPAARLSLVDEGDLRPELGAGLRRGKLLDKARISITRGERRWELTLDGGMLTYDSLRCPPLGDRDPGLADDRRAAFENDLFLRLADIEDAVGVIDWLFAAFCKVRASSSWADAALPSLQAWVAELGRTRASAAGAGGD